MKKMLKMSTASGGIRRMGGVYVTALLMVLSAQVAWGKVTGSCVNCHTMHNSQDGSSVVDSDDGLQPALTTTTCVGCHSSEFETIKDLGGSRVPIVYTTGEPNLTAGQSNSMLAGGNFHWVAQVGGDTKGHNVFGLSGIDPNLTKAPGGAISAGGNSPCYDCHVTLSTLESGCKGCHLPAHHTDDSVVVVDADHGSYRFLGDVMAVVSGGAHEGGRIGLKGIEDPDWEQTVSSTDHNVYAGTTKLYQQVYGKAQLDTIGQMCAGCHGDFHDSMNSGQFDDSVSDAWIRHPSDVLIPNSGEYAAYTVYNPLAPVAKVGISADMENTPTVTPGEDIVTCLSCHRPHGSPYPDMLRWDYGSCVAGTGDTDNECGCFVCHTAKD